MGIDTKNVFISHIHEDDPGLAKLKGLLGPHGMNIRDYSINADNPNNAHNEDYIKTSILAPRIRQSGVLLVYLSPDTKDSKYVNWEIEYAQKQGKRIVGVWAHGERGCELPEALENYADAVVGWQGTSIIDAINGELDGWYGADGVQREPLDIPRHNCR